MGTGRSHRFPRSEAQACDRHTPGAAIKAGPTTAAPHSEPSSRTCVSAQTQCVNVLRNAFRGRATAHLQDLPVQEGHEADAGEEEKSEDQQVPRRAQGADGHRPPERRGERLQARESRHPGADGPPSPQAEEAAASLRQPGDRRRQIQSRVHPLCQRGLQVLGGHPRSRRPTGHQADDPPGAPTERDGQSVSASDPSGQSLHPSWFSGARDDDAGLLDAADAGVVHVVTLRTLSEPADRLLHGGTAEGGPEERANVEAVVKTSGLL